MATQGREKEDSPEIDGATVRVRFIAHARANNTEDNTMKRILVAMVFGFLLAAACAFVPGKPLVKKGTATVRADGGGVCSPATVAGNYGFTLSGTLIFPNGPVPGAAIGRAKLSADGRVSGMEARNVGGGFANETFNGTSAVNSDCTGTATIQFFESGSLVRTSAIAIVWDDNLNEFRFVQESLVLPDGTNVPVVVTGEARRISASSGE